MSSSDASPTLKVKREPTSRVHHLETSRKRVSHATPVHGQQGWSGENEENIDSDEEGIQDIHGDGNESQDEQDAERKRRKRLKRLDGRPRPSEAATGKEGNEFAFETAAIKVFVRDPKDGYLPGSIVRICCQNFLTYDFVQFSPGARMNMILGPNGTGKSTIACAISIGLGFPTSVLGRATELQAFVKHGYEQGYVEIELKGKLGKNNVVVRRNINVKSNASTWSMNGKSVPKSKVDEEDRVNEFAKLKPEELLVETQKVAGHPRLKDWHDSLIEMGKGLKEIKEALVVEQQDCSNEEGKNSLLEREVAAFNKRKQLEEELTVYNILIPYYVYRRDKAVFSAVRSEWRAAGLKWEEALKKHQPATDFKAKLEKNLKDASKEAEDVEKTLGNVKADIEKLKNKDRTLDAECRRLGDDILALGQNEEDSKKKIRESKAKIIDCQNKIRHIQEELQNDNLESLTAHKEQLNARLNKFRLDRKNIQQNIEELEGDVRQAETDARRAQEQLTALNDVKQQRYRSMEHSTDPKLRGISDENFMRAFKWFSENRDQFSEYVEPACFSVSIKNPRYSHAVENCISVAQMKTFVLKTKDDYDRFNDYMDRRPFGDYRPTVWYRPQPGDERAEPLEEPPRSREELRGAGFDGYAIDFVEAPPLMQFFLKKNLDMHRIPVAVSSRSIDLDQAARMFAPRESGSTRFIAGQQLNTLTRSAYGRRLVQNSSVNIRPAVWFTEQPIDMERHRSLESTIHLANEAAEEKRTQIIQLERKDTRLKEEERGVKEQHAETTEKLNKIRTRKTDLKRYERTMEQAQQELTAEENRPSVERRAATMHSNLANKIKSRIEIIPRLKAMVEAAGQEVERFTVSTFNVIQAQADVAKMGRIIEVQTAAHRELERKHSELQQKAVALKAELNEKQKAIIDLTEAASDEVKQRVETYKAEHEGQENIDQLLDRLEQERAESQSMLEMTTRVNHTVIQTYNERKTRIKRLRDSIQRREQDKQNAERRIGRVKDQWLPQLNALINRVNERFSAAFDRIRCAGEVRLAQHEDYEKWAIEILVKFRSNEPLQLLTGQRQSGGERSLTTILYLMSLTGLAKTPFALVDEINQGMDAKYERAVHNELIQVTCAEDSGQYFLITPKLLPNLTYHENVTALVINNGDHLPETRDEKGKATSYGDLGTNLAAYRRAMRNI